MTTVRERWLDVGLSVLTEEGVSGVRIDRIASRVGLSKGSFFHHFSGIAQYRADLLRRWESSAVAGLRAEAAQSDLPSLAERVGDLVDLRTEVAVRAWAFQDADAAEVLERVDRARLAAVEEIWTRLTDDPERAHAAALLPHLIVIGASMARPQPSRAELEAVFAILAELVAQVADR